MGRENGWAENQNTVERGNDFNKAVEFIQNYLVETLPEAYDMQQILMEVDPAEREKEFYFFIYLQQDSNHIFEQVKALYLLNYQEFNTCFVYAMAELYAKRYDPNLVTSP